MAKSATMQQYKEAAQMIAEVKGYSDWMDWWIGVEILTVGDLTEYEFYVYHPDNTLIAQTTCPVEAVEAFTKYPYNP